MENQGHDETGHDPEHEIVPAHYDPGQVYGLRDDERQHVGNDAEVTQLRPRGPVMTILHGYRVAADHFAGVLGFISVTLVFPTVIISVVNVVLRRAGSRGGQEPDVELARRGAVVPLHAHLHLRLRLHPARRHQRAGRLLVRQSLEPDAIVDRPDRSLHRAAPVRLHRHQVQLAVGAAELGGPREVTECRRPPALSDQDRDACSRSCSWRSRASPR